MADQVSNHTYRVIVTREDGNWLADVSELEGAHTYARSLPSLDRAVREVIVLAADLPDEAMPELRLDFEYRTGDPRIDQDAAKVRRLRAQLAEVESLTAASIDALTPELSVRDAGMLLGVSPQRVSQLASKRAARRGKRVKVTAITP
jgi:predicted RNase H-like HicB family nuclease